MIIYLITIFAKFVINSLYPKSDNTWMFRLWELSVRNRHCYFYTYFLFMTLEVIFDSIEPYALSQLTQLTLENKILLIKIIAVLFFNRIFEITKDKIASIFYKEFSNDLRKEYYTSLLKEDIEFFSNKKSSDLFSMITKDVPSIQSVSLINFLNLIKQIVQSLFCFIMLFFISKKLAIFLCIFVPSFALLNSARNTYLIRRETEKFSDKKESHSMVLEALENMKIIKTFSSEDKEYKKYSNKLDKMFNDEYKSIITSGIYDFISLIIFSLAIFSGIKYGISLIKENALNVETLAQFFFYCKIVNNGFSNVVRFTRDVTKSNIIAEHLFSTLDHKPKINTYYPESEKNKNLNEKKGIEKKINGEITIKNTTFKYPNKSELEEVEVLKNINLKINSGMSIGIVGLSGSGKSTIINLLLRLYDIDLNIENNKNGIFYDNTNIKDYMINYLHYQIGYVQQEPSLFNGTIFENIIYGIYDNLNTNDLKNKYKKEVEWAINISQANFIYDKNLFPEGMDTVVGPRGSKLSGGQRQRIAIARALVKKPKVLILDEATSALDSDSEFNFKKELDKLKGMMTFVIVSHRLCTIKDCDKIIVINKGEIAESGTHDELCKLKNIYYTLMEKQLED